MDFIGMDPEKVQRALFQDFNKHKKNNQLKVCFHEDENCNERIIKAHSVQNNKILNVISEDGHVHMFGSELDEGYQLKAKMQNKGRKVATTFTGFCGYHDNEIFKPIEAHHYITGNKEQDFLFAYRALAKEYHAKKTTTDMYRDMFRLLTEGKYAEFSSAFQNSNPTEEHLQAMRFMVDGLLKGSRDSEERIERFRSRMNKFLNQKEFEEIVTKTIVFEAEYHLAVSSMLYLEKDLRGRQINDLEDWEHPLAPFFITAFPQAGKTVVLLSCFKRNERRYRNLFNDIDNLSTKEKQKLISNIIISYVENFAISPISWRKLNEEQQREINEKFLDSTFEFHKNLDHEEGFNLFIEI